MRSSRLVLAAVAATALVCVDAARVIAQKPAATIEAFLSPAYPFDLVSARKTDRLAWIAYDQGKRNVYTAVPSSSRNEVSRTGRHDGATAV